MEQVQVKLQKVQVTSTYARIGQNNGVPIRTLFPGNGWYVPTRLSLCTFTSNKKLGFWAHPL